MSNARALRYRRLALAEKDKAIADLLLKLADECDRGILCTAEWRSARPPRKKMSSRQEPETPSSGLSGTHSIETEPPGIGAGAAAWAQIESRRFGGESATDRSDH